MNTQYQIMQSQCLQILLIRFPVQTIKRNKAVQDIPNTRAIKKPSTDCLIEGLKLYLYNNNSVFANKNLLQTNGTATGAPNSCSYADIAVASTMVQYYGIFFFYLGFLSRAFTNHRTAREGGGYFFNSSLLLPPASQTLRHQLGDYCRELTSAHS